MFLLTAMTHSLTSEQSKSKYYMEIKCQLDATDEFLLQILLLTQHVSGTPHYTDNLKTKHQIRQTATTCITL
jgi:hypothetical protein